MIVRAMRTLKKHYHRALKMRITTTCLKNQHLQRRMVGMLKIANGERSTTTPATIAGTSSRCKSNRSYRSHQANQKVGLLRSTSHSSRRRSCTTTSANPTSAKTSSRTCWSQPTRSTSKTSTCRYDGLAWTYRRAWSPTLKSLRLRRGCCCQRICRHIWVINGYILSVWLCWLSLRNCMRVLIKTCLSTSLSRWCKNLDQYSKRCTWNPYYNSNNNCATQSSQTHF